MKIKELFGFALLKMTANAKQIPCSHTSNKKYRTKAERKMRNNMAKVSRRKNWGEA